MTEEARRKSLVAVLLSSLGVGIAFGLGYPLASVALEAHGEPQWIIGLAGAAPSLGVLLVLPLMPKAMARVEPVRVILGGCALCALGYASLYWANGPVAWIVIRLLMGGAVAMPWLVGETWINYVATARSRTRVVSLYATAFFVGFALGPLFLDALPIDGPWPYLAGVLGVFLAALPIYLLRHHAPDLAHEPGTGIWGGLRMAPAAMAGGFLAGYLETTSYALLPSAAMAMGLDKGSALTLLTIFSVGGLTTQFILGWIGDKTSRRGLLIAIGAAYSGLVLLMPWAAASTALAMAHAFVLGSLVISFYTIGLTLVGEDVPPKDLATANAAFILTYTLSSIIGPALTGALMTSAPAGGYVWGTLTAAALLTALIAALGQPRRAI